MLPAIRQWWESRLYHQPKQVLDLATPEGCKAELTYITWKRTGRKLNRRLVSRKCNALPRRNHVTSKWVSKSRYLCDGAKSQKRWIRHWSKRCIFSFRLVFYFKANCCLFEYNFFCNKTTRVVQIFNKSYEYGINELSTTAEFQCPYYFASVRWLKYCDQRGMYVCLSVRSRISKIARPNFTKFSIHVTCGRGSVFFWRHYNMLCTSGFLDNIMILHNGTNGPESDGRYFVVRQVALRRPNLLCTIAGLF